MKTLLKQNNTKDIQLTKEQMEYIEECIRISEEQFKNGEYLTIEEAYKYVKEHTKGGK